MTILTVTDGDKDRLGRLVRDHRLTYAPDWNDLSDEQRAPWIAGAEAVADEVLAMVEEQAMADADITERSVQ